MIKINLIKYIINLANIFTLTNAHRADIMDKRLT